MANGAPSVVKRSMVKPPVSRIGAARKAEVYEIVIESPLADKYDTTVDRESAFENLARRADQAAKAAVAKKPAPKRRHAAPKPRGRPRQGIAETFVKSVVRSLGSRTGRALVRGIMGSLFKGR